MPQSRPHPPGKRQFHRLSLYLGLAFMAIWALVIGWEFGTVRGLDWRIASLLNDTLGHSETWDLMVLFLSLPPGDVLGAAAIVAISIKLVRDTPHAGAARYLAFGLTIVLLAAVTDELVDTCDEYVLRHGPVAEIAGFRNPGTSLEIPHPLPPITRFPSDRAANYTMVFFLCLFRFGRRAWPLALLPLVSGVVHVTAGKFWPTDVAGGMLLGWTIASVLYAARINELINYVEGFIEARASGPADRWARRAIAGSPEAPRKRDAAALDNAGISAEGDGERAVIGFVRDQWPCTEVEFGGLAHKGKVFSLVCDGRRVVLKKSRFRGERRSHLAEALRRSRELRERGILPAPALIASRSGSLLVESGELAWYLSEWVDGSPVDFADPDALGPVMERLANLHASTVQAEDGDPVAAIAREAEMRASYFGKRLARADVLGRSPFGIFIPPNAEHQGVGALVAEGARSRFVAEQAVVYALRDRPATARCIVHGDTHPMNFLVGPGGEIAFLDIDGICPGFAYSDLVMPLAKLMRRTGWDPEQFDRALRRYEAVRPLARWELCLLVADVMYPRALRELPTASRLRQRSVGRLSRMRLLRAELESALERKKRDDFLAAVALRRDVLLIAGHSDGRQPTPVPEHAG